MQRPLILIPTSAEYRIVQPRLVAAGVAAESVQLCGFGLIAAAARTMQLIAQRQPDGILLVGIAGSFESDTLPGTAMLFDEVTCFGIGAGTGADHQSAQDMGWPQIPGESGDGDIGDTIPIPGLRPPSAGPRAARLLSVTAASGDANDAAMRRQKFPDAAAEDMEGYGIALACTLTNTPFDIVRGISNSAGDRNTANWKIHPALEAATDLAVELISD